MPPQDWFTSMVEREAHRVMREDLNILSGEAIRRAITICANKRGYDLDKAQWLYNKGLEYRKQRRW